MAMKGKMMILRRAQLLCVLLVLCCAANVFADNIFKDLYYKFKDKITGVISLDDALKSQGSLVTDMNGLLSSTSQAVESATKVESAVSETAKASVTEALNKMKVAKEKAKEAKSAAETFKASVTDMQKKMAEIDAKVEELKAKSDTKVLTEETKRKANEIRDMTTQASSLWDRAIVEVAAQTSTAGATVTAMEEAKNKIGEANKLVTADTTLETANNVQTTKNEMIKAKDIIDKAATDVTALRSSAEKIQKKVNGASESYRRKLGAVKTMMNNALGIDGGSFIVPNMIVCLASFLFVAFSF